jgi:hypothetical protein
MARAAQSRTNLRVPPSMHRDLTTYALAAGAAGVSAMALSQPANSQIVYTPAHGVIGRDQTIAIDLNHDGITDFTIRNIFTSTRSGGEEARLYVQFKQGAGVIYVGSSSAAPLNKGAPIGPPNKFSHQGFEAMADQFYFLDGGTYSFGRWINVSNRYLGLRFRINGQVHFGWARLSTKCGHFQIAAVLTGYAYETQANTPIASGDEGNGNNAVMESPMSPTETEVRASLAVLALGSDGLAIWRRP